MQSILKLRCPRHRVTSPLKTSHWKVQSPVRGRCSLSLSSIVTPKNVVCAMEYPVAFTCPLLFRQTDSL